jgi:hypothetical protein
MIDLTSLRIYVDFRPDFKEDGFHRKNYKKRTREDGLIEFIEDNRIKTIQIKTEDFRVDIHNTDYPNEDTSWSWNFVLPVLKEYFIYKADVEIMRTLCGKSCFDFELGVYREEPKQSEQDDMFIANYTDWVFLQFGYEFSNLHSMTDFHRLLNNKYHTHQVMDREWPETKMFIEKLTLENFSFAIETLIKLIKMETEITNAMYKVRKDFYKKHEDLWVEKLEGK